MKKLDLLGKSFGRLTVTASSDRVGGKVTWRCRCSCGRSTIVMSTHLVSGHTQSCGCLMREIASQIGKRAGLHMFKHGESWSNSAEYRSWRNMLNRCYNKKNQAYDWYGGRGITVCSRWRGPSGFQTFLEDMGRKPSSAFSIERKNNDRGYSKSNCIWATRAQQNSNTRRNVHLTFRGKTQTLTEWARELGITQTGLRYRLRNWTPERVFVEAA